MRTIVYVDGFNLYNRRLKNKSQWKWLNLKALADNILLPPMVVTRVNYYTARVSGEIDADAPRRQEAYLKALRSVQEIKIHYGKFLFSEHWAAPVVPPDTRPAGYAWALPIPDLIWVKKAEEKGSDVNLGSHLVRDALTDQFDRAIVITNDTDLIEPIRIAREEAGKSVGLLSPVVGKMLPNGRLMGASERLVAVSDFTLYIHNKHLAQSQFSTPVGGATRPAGWV